MDHPVGQCFFDLFIGMKAVGAFWLLAEPYTVTQGFVLLFWIETSFFSALLCMQNTD